MPEGLDQARDAFAQEIAPASQPRDQAGRFVTQSKPEPIFQPRPIEGDERGDVSDGGADPRLIEHERRIADGRSEEGDEGAEERRRLPDGARARNAAARRGHEPAEGEPGRSGSEAPDDGGLDAQDEDARGGPQGTSEQDADGEGKGPRYEVTIDGETREITLDEALKGYSREETHNSRMAKLADFAKRADQEMATAVQARDAYIAALASHEQEFAAIIPAEPNWDELFRADPKGAHELQKNFQAVHGKLNALRSARAQAMAEAQADHARRTAEYAQGEFRKFLADNRIADEETKNKELGYMRSTARAAGFSEDEISTVYDSRMLTILRKASKYDRMMANRPAATAPDKGRTLTPGAARPIGNATRKNFDDAQRKLAASGRIEDAQEVFARMLR